MPLIGTSIEPRSVARLFFDCRAAEADPNDEARIVQAIELAATLAATQEASQTLPHAA
jgi:hypothetical protein